MANDRKPVLYVRDFSTHYERATVAQIERAGYAPVADLDHLRQAAELLRSGRQGLYGISSEANAWFDADEARQSAKPKRKGRR